MATYGYGAAQFGAHPQPHAQQQQHHNHHPHSHHGRGRRGPRVSSQNAHRHYKANRSPKDIPEPAVYSEYLARLEAARSFEFDDDEVFCPFHLLTEDDLQSIHSSSASDRASLTSSSPDGSPLQQQAQPTPQFLLSAAAAAASAGYHGAGFQHQQHVKLHQPMAQRTRNAIPIVDPSTRSVASPPLSISPARQMQQFAVNRRW